jgi:hypothetical protein
VYVPFLWVHDVNRAQFLKIQVTAFHEPAVVVDVVESRKRGVVIIHSTILIDCHQCQNSCVFIQPPAILVVVSIFTIKRVV